MLKFLLSWLMVMAGGLLWMGCRQRVEARLTGHWRIDSVYDYNNGFTFTNRNPYPREEYEYRNNHTVVRKGMGEQLEYTYTCKDSVLRLINSAGSAAGEFIILYLDRNLLALKINKQPLFTGKNQQWYEVLYFTRIDPLVSK